MKSFTSVLVAGFAALAQAVILTNTDFTVKAGQPFEITWAEAQGPVTLTLKNGANSDLKTVQTITSGATGTSYTWTPSSSLPSDTYAIEISDGTDVNYSVQFPFVGTGSASPSATATATTVASSSASATVTTTVTSASASSASSSDSASVSSAANSTSASASSTVATSTRSSTRTAATTGSTTAPTTVPGGDAGRIGSPIALIGLTIAAMLYFQ